MNLPFFSCPVILLVFFWIVLIFVDFFHEPFLTLLYTVLLLCFTWRLFPVAKRSGNALQIINRYRGCWMTGDGFHVIVGYSASACVFLFTSSTFSGTCYTIKPCSNRKQWSWTGFLADCVMMVRWIWSAHSMQVLEQEEPRLHCRFSILSYSSIEQVFHNTIVMQ